MSVYEKEVAIKETGTICASDLYFEARPELDTPENRKLYEDGFSRGWDNVKTGKFSNGAIIPAIPFVQDDNYPTSNPTQTICSNS